MQVDPESAHALNLERRVDNVRIAVNPARVRRKGRKDGVFNVDPVERTLGERVHTAVDANGRRSACNQQQVAAAASRKQPQPPLEARQIASTR